MGQTILIYANRRQRTKLAKQGVDILVEYEDYVLARVTEEEAARLQAGGYEVEAFAGESDRKPGNASAGVPAARRFTESGAERPQRDLPSQYGPGHHYYRVSFIGPVKSEWLDEIAAHGGRPLEPLPPASYIVALDDPAFAWLTEQPRYVLSVNHYSPELRMSPGLIEGLSSDPHVARGAIKSEDAVGTKPPANVERVPMAFTVHFFEPDNVAEALPFIRDLGAQHSDPAPGSRIITVTFHPPDPNLAGRVEQLAHIHGVRSVEPFVLRQLRNDMAVRLMEAMEVSNPSGLGLSGRGEIVGVADSGLDTGDPDTIHPDFSGRIIAIRSWPVSTDWAAVVTNVGEDDGPADARSGHGTHVAGSVCGSGKASLSVQADAVRGLAFDATLVFQAIEQRLKWTDSYRQAYYQHYRRYPPDYGLAGLPADLAQLFSEAYDAGVRVHNNSWGGGDFGAYDSYAEAVDRFIWEHKDFLVLFAAGNDGSDGDRDGVVDQESVTPPGTAKNCLTVGAAESVRSQGGYQSVYGQLWPSDYPANPLRNDRPADNPDDLAAFSSRGPTRDGRLKPDVVAPGTNILSVRSQALTAGGNPGWGAWPASNYYMFNGGTSMSTPLVAGAAAVVRDFLHNVKRRANPSAALVKATLVHGAQHRSYRHAPDGEPRLLDVAQGWGHVTLQGVLAPETPVQVRWYDQRRGLSTGQSWRWSVWVNDASVPLAITLVWSDYPGSAGIYPNLVNDLDLVVTSPSGTVNYGNGGVGQPGSGPDRTNNVERILIPQPELGRYRIRVRAFNVPRGPQDFALVYSGGIR